MVSPKDLQCCLHGAGSFLFFCFFLQILRFYLFFFFFLFIVHSYISSSPKAAAMQEVDAAIQANDVPRLVAALKAPGILLLWTIILPERRTKANVRTSLQ